MLKNVILMAVFIVYMSLLYFCNSVFAMKKATDADMALNKTILTETARRIA